MLTWIVNPFDNITLDGPFTGRYETLVHHLLAAGHSAEWFISSWNHTEKRWRRFGQGRKEVSANFAVNSIPVRPYTKNFSLARILNHRDYARGVGKAMAESKGRPEVVVVSLPPREAVAAVLDYAEPRGIPVVVDVQDLWPEALPLLFPKKLQWAILPAGRIARWWEDRTVRRATAIFAVCEAYAQRGVTAWADPTSVPCSFEYIGVDLEKFDAVTGEFSPEDGKREPFFVFVGMIGAMADLATILRAWEILQKSGRPPLLRIFGEGPELSSHLAYARKHRLDQVIFHGRKPWEECVRALRAAHAGLNVYVKAMDERPNNAMGNKVFEYMAARLPVINSVPGELATLIDQREMGWNFTAGDPESLAQAISEVLASPQEAKRRGENARSFAEEKADRRVSYPRYVRFLENIARPKR